MSVGLGGDGDEVVAIERVESEFGVWLGGDDAAGWVTAGDVYASLLKVLPVEARANRNVWERFAAALAHETGVDPARIEESSRLLC
jgi:hypothetical protein